MSEIKTLNLCASFVFAGTLKSYNKRHFLNKKENPVFSMFDDLSNGPITNLNINLEQRMTWAKTINDRFKLFMLSNSLNQDYNELFGYTKKIDKNTKIVIWYADNVLEKTNFMFFVNLFKDFDIYAVNATDYVKIKCENENLAIISSAECKRKHIKTLKQNIVKLSDNEKENAVKVWESLIKSDKRLRILENGNIKNVDEDFFDNMLLDNVGDDFEPSLKVCGKVLSEVEQYVNDQFLMYRLVILAKSKKLQIRKPENVQQIWEVKKYRSIS